MTTSTKSNKQASKPANKPANKPAIKQASKPVIPAISLVNDLIKATSRVSTAPIEEPIKTTYSTIQELDTFPGMEQGGDHMVTRSYTIAALIASGMLIMSKNGLPSKPINKGSISAFMAITHSKVRGAGFTSKAIMKGEHIKAASASMARTKGYGGDMKLINQFVEAMKSTSKRVLNVSYKGYKKQFKLVHVQSV